MQAIRKRLTYANVISTLALFLVLGGRGRLRGQGRQEERRAGAAEGQRGDDRKNQGERGDDGKIKKNAVTNAKIKNGAVDDRKDRRRRR